MSSEAGNTNPTPSFGSENQIEGRERVYEDAELAITKWDHGPRLPHYYQIIAKDDARKRSGDGYILLSAQAMQRMCNQLAGRVW